MAIWEWLRELPIIDDMADAVEIFAEFLPEAGSGDVLVRDYAELRESMHWTIGENGFDTRQHLLIDSSLEPVSFDQDGRVTSGLWRDPLTGFESNDPSEFDIDHRVPFRAIADQFPQLYDLPREEQLAIYNDGENLQVIHDEHNLDKGADTPELYARALEDADTRQEFLKRCADYVGRLAERFG